MIPDRARCGSADTVWMPHSRRWDDMAGPSMPYDLVRTVPELRKFVSASRLLPHRRNKLSKTVLEQHVNGIHALRSGTGGATVTYVLL